MSQLWCMPGCKKNGEDFRVTATRIDALDEATSTAAAGLQVFLQDETPIETLSLIIREHGAKGNGRILLMLDLPEQDVEIDIKDRFQITPEFRSAVKAVTGVIDVRDI